MARIRSPTFLGSVMLAKWLSGHGASAPLSAADTVHVGPMGYNRIAADCAETAADAVRRLQPTLCLDPPQQVQQVTGGQFPKGLPADTWKDVLSKLAQLLLGIVRRPGCRTAWRAIRGPPPRKLPAARSALVSFSALLGGARVYAVAKQVAGLAVSVAGLL